MLREPGPVTNRSWVVVLAEAEGLRWVLKHARMAFTTGSAQRAAKIQRGDGIILYVARGAFHNPTRDESQLIAVARANSEVRAFRHPVEIAGRRFVAGCTLHIEVALPEKKGVPIRPLVRQLGLVRRKEVWGQYFRSGLVQVPIKDFELLARHVHEAAEGT